MTACAPSVWDAPAVRAPRPCKPYGAAGVPAPLSSHLAQKPWSLARSGSSAALVDELAPVTAVTPPRESTHCPLAHPPPRIELRVGCDISEDGGCRHFDETSGDKPGSCNLDFFVWCSQLPLQAPSQSLPLPSPPMTNAWPVMPIPP